VLEYEVGEPPLETALRDRLQRRGSDVTSKTKDGTTVIRLTDLRETRQVLSVGSDGKALEYELITRVTFDARTGTNVWQMPTQIEARQPYSFNAQQVLAKEQEADRLRAYLQDQLAEILLLRLEAAASRATLPAGTPATPPDVVPPVPPPIPSPPAEAPQAPVAPAEAPPAPLS
jgi:LPS-assembly lipoprotein